MATAQTSSNGRKRSSARGGRKSSSKRTSTKRKHTSATKSRTGARKTSARKTSARKTSTRKATSATKRSAKKSPTKRKGATKRRYGAKSQEKVEKSMHELKRGQLRSGGSGKKVTSRKQAIAIGLSEARRAGGKLPPPKGRKS